MLVRWPPASATATYPSRLPSTAATPPNSPTPASPPPSLCLQGYAWFFLCYEATLHALAGPAHQRQELDYKHVLGAGVMAGFGLWGSMFPIDTIKSKMQVGGWGCGGSSGGAVGRLGICVAAQPQLAGACQA